MTTEREQLEFAAKAAGIELRWSSDETAYSDSQCKGYWAVWNPKHDDGDSRRLQVALRMDVEFNSTRVFVSVGESDDYVSIFEPLDDNPAAAVRLAVLRCAAEVGRSM